MIWTTASLFYGKAQGSQDSVNLYKVTQLVSGKTGIQTQLFLTPQSPDFLFLESRIKLSDVSTWNLEGEKAEE